MLPASRCNHCSLLQALTFVEYVEKSTSTTTAFRRTSELTQVRPALELINLDWLVVISVGFRVMNQFKFTIANKVDLAAL